MDILMNACHFNHWQGEDFGCNSTFCKHHSPHLQVSAWGQLWQGDEGVGKATPTHPAGPGRETGRQEGTTRPWKHKKGKTKSRFQENPLSLASSEAFSANSKSWGATAHKPWPLLSSLERKKKTGRKWVALRRLLRFQSKKECFWCLHRDRARSQEAAFVVPVKGAMLTWNSWIGLISWKTSCQTKWEMEFSREVCADSPPTCPQIGFHRQSAHDLGSLTQVPASGNFAGRSPSSPDMPFCSWCTVSQQGQTLPVAYHLSGFLFLSGEKSTRQRWL